MGSTSRRRDGGPATLSRAWRRVPLLLLTAALVVSTGTVVASITASAPPPSTTEQARLDALAGLEGLAAAFEKHDDGDSPTAALLRSQADLLTLTTSWPSGSPAAAETTEVPSAAGPDAPPAPQQPGAEDLAELAGSLLADARETDPGLARLLASIGASLYAQAQTLPGGTAVAPPWEDPEIPLEPTGCPAEAPTEDESGPATPASPTTAEAIAVVVLSQERLAYAYETVLPHLAGADRAAAAARLAAHTDSAEHWRSLAVAECLDLPLPEPAYPLGDEFASDPLPALEDAEAAALAPLADLVALSDGTVREHAVAGFAEAATELAASAGEVLPAPGLDDELRAAPTTAP
ncbi:DUF4439 domain-containing protein [Arthrobacter sulfonylureivorans]|uniref:DUF4439 domain-containing protein n=1 Tax=Arthrobacter sulfonylureivorans TaxID=2486855 RepID=UPI0039E3C76D